MTELGLRNGIQVGEAKNDDRGLWGRWIAANSIGEMIGLGGTALAGIFVASVAGDDSSLTWRVIAFAVIAFAGIFEGVAVGLAQWLAMRRSAPEISRFDWTLATALGAFIAWILGMIPSFLMENDGAPSGPGPDTGMVILLAAAMGIVLGPVLGVPQWMVLRRYVPNAGWWIAANSAAWGVGMPIIFIGIGMIFDGNNPMSINIAMGAATCAIAGAGVGAVHGAVLRHLLGRREMSPASVREDS